METSYFVGIFLAIYLIILLVAVVIGIASKIIQMIYAKKCGARLYGLVWLPVGNEYVLGQLADMYENKNARKIYPVLSAVYMVIMLVFEIFFFIVFFTKGDSLNNSDIFSVVGPLLLFELLILGAAIGFAVYAYILYYRIFCAKDRKNAVIWLLLSIFFGIPFFIFMCVNMNKPTYSKYPVFYQDQQ